MKSVLVIAYYFPPLGGGGVHRTLKFVRYLPTFGWRPIVLTASGQRGVMEPALLSEIPSEAVVESVRYVEPGHIIDGVRRFRSRKPEKTSPNGAGQSQARIDLKPGLARRVLDNIFVPDRQVTWVASAYRTGMRLIKQYDIRALYSSHNPGSAHVIGGLLKRRTGLPWIADFRDPWLNSYLAETWSPWQRFVTESLERWTIRHADHITAVSEALIDDMHSDHLQVQFPPGTVIPNGFDPDDFKRPRARARERFTMVYAGTVYPDRDPAPVLTALTALFRQGRLKPSDVELRFIGTVPTEWLQRVREGELKDVVTVTGQKSHEQAIEELLSAHLLWMTITPGPSSGSVLSLKVFEYLASGRPVLYVGPESAASHVLSRATGADIVPYDSVDTIADRIMRRFETFARDGIETFDREAYVSQWTRQSLTGKLAALLDRVSQSS